MVLNGPNLNLLGERERDLYGQKTLPEIERILKKTGEEMGCEVFTAQANGEGELIDLLQKNRKWAHGIVFNPGAYTHYSYALRDAVAAINLPVIEVHLSNIQARENFRGKSVISPKTLGQITGLGWKGYVLALCGLISSIKEDGFFCFEPERAEDS